jgi:hypothetical protein
MGGRPFSRDSGVNTGGALKDTSRGDTHMARFIFTYRQQADYVAGADVTVAWGQFFERIGPSVVEPGQPVFERTTVGDTGASTRLGGYSVIEADDLEAALALARACPTLQHGGGVEVGMLAELPPDHPASRLKRTALTSA